MTTLPLSYQGYYIHGHFVAVTNANGEVFSRNPGNLDAPAVACPFNYELIHEAVLAAGKATASWRRLTLSDRLSALSRYRDQLHNERDALAEIISLETGKPFWEASLEVTETLGSIDYYLTAARNTPIETHKEDNGSTTRVIHPARGVAAVIAPGISPLLDSHLHFFPALIYGNTVVLKAARHAPLVGQAIAQCMHQAQMPSGVFNLIQGEAEVARRLVSHSDVQLVFFTGSYETGLQIRKQVLSDYWKVVVLDMVGKNGVLVWEDCQYEQALLETLYCCLLTCGQRRTTANRVLVHHSLLDRFQEDLHELAKKASVGYPADRNAEVFLGPLLHNEAVENYLRYQGMALREGCEEVMRGKALERTPKGHYVSPSIHLVGKADPKSVYQRSEIFGPNIALYSVEDLDEAVEILNLSQYGLVASVYSKSQTVFSKVCDTVRVGTLHLNRPTHTPTYHLPRGGLKKSGNARPLGSLAWQQCTYPVTTTEYADKWNADSLPRSLPRGVK